MRYSMHVSMLPETN